MPKHAECDTVMANPSVCACVCLSVYLSARQILALYLN